MATDEQFELLAKYLSVRHPDGGMSTMDELDYADMVEHTPVTSTLVEYREPTEDGSPGKLVGACLTDRQGDGLSMIYSFYDPDHGGRAGLGNYIILDHIVRAGQVGLPYVYLAIGSMALRGCNIKCAIARSNSLPGKVGSVWIKRCRAN